MDDLNKTAVLLGFIALLLQAAFVIVSGHYVSGAVIVADSILLFAFARKGCEE